MILRIPLLACLFAAFFASYSNADVTISYGRLDGGIRYIDLQPNLAMQSVQFFVTGVPGDGGADGLELDLQVGDGGAALGGSDTGPVIGDIDLITGTIWENFGPNQQDVVVTPLAKQSTVDTTSLVSADGLIGTVNFDTTGFNNGFEIEFRLTGVAGNFDTTLFQGANPLVTNAPNGFIRIVPEPGSAAVLVGLASAVFLRRRRR